MLIMLVYKEGEHLESKLSLPACLSKQDSYMYVQ